VIDFIIFSSLFLFYSSSVLYAHWRGFTMGMEAGKSLNKVKE
jgi:hypothetical protein